MTVRLLLAAALACAPALHGQALVLQPERLLPSTDTMYTVRGEGGDTIATSIQTLWRSVVDGRDVWTVEYAYFQAGARTVDTTTFDPATLLPLAQRRTGPARVVSVDFDGADVRIRLRRAGEDAPQVWSRHLDPPVFAGSLMDIVYRALPLEDGYRAARIPFLIPERDTVWWADVRVTGPQPLEVRRALVQAWRVQAGAPGLPPEVFWISVADRMLLRIDHSNGDTTLR